MSEKHSDSGIPAAVGMFGGVFAAARISDAVSGNNVVFIGLWIVCGLIFYAVAVVVAGHLEKME